MLKMIIRAGMTESASVPAIGIGKKGALATANAKMAILRIISRLFERVLLYLRKDQECRRHAIDHGSHRWREIMHFVIQLHCTS